MIFDKDLPRFYHVSEQGCYRVTIPWTDGLRGGSVETVDLAPAIFRYKLYVPLRSDLDLFRSVHVADDGYAIAWGCDDVINMVSTAVEELARQTMQPVDFAAFVKRHGYTLDSIAAELGDQPAPGGLYQREKTVPRSIALACAYLEEHAKSSSTAVDPVSPRLRVTAKG